MAKFKDIEGKEWIVRVTVGKAMKLRSELGIDVQTFMETGSEDLEKLLTDGWKLVEILSILLVDQVEKAGLSDEEFFDRLTGDTLDEASIAFLEAVAESLPKLKRLPMLRIVAKLRGTLNKAASSLETKADSLDLETEVMEKVTKTLENT